MTDVNSNVDAAQERFTNHLFEQSLKPVAGSFGSTVRVPSKRHRKVQREAKWTCGLPLRSSMPFMPAWWCITLVVD